MLQLESWKSWQQVNGRLQKEVAKKEKIKRNTKPPLAADWLFQEQRIIHLTNSTQNFLNLLSLYHSQSNDETKQFEFEGIVGQSQLRLCSSDSQLQHNAKSLKLLSLYKLDNLKRALFVDNKSEKFYCSESVVYGEVAS